MAQAKQILRRVKSVTNTRKITRAMEMVASAKLKGAQRKALELKRYAGRVLGLLQAALANHGMSHHPLLQERPVEKTAVVLLTSDKGLCGGYNVNVVKRAMRVWHEVAGGKGGFIVVGAKGRDVLRRRKLPIYRELSVDGGKPSYQDAARVTEWVVGHYNERAVDRVVLVYTDFVNAASQVPAVMDLLPLSSVTPDFDGARDLYWDPSPREVLDRLIPEYLGTMVYRALLEATASEFAARRVAMKSATDNATEMIGDLTLQYNRARQAAITQEIAEIVGGANALE